VNVVLIILLTATLIHYEIPQKVYFLLFKQRQILSRDYDNTTVMREIFANYQPSRGRIVFVGDSLIQYLDWNELLGRQDIVNRGIGGERTGDVLKRIDDILTLEPRQIFLLVGINDVMNDVPTEKIHANYTAILERLTDGGIPVICLSVIKGRDVAKNAVIDRVNSDIHQAANQYNAHFIDLNAYIVMGDFISPEYSYDGLHLRGKAYRVIAFRLSPLMREPIMNVLDSSRPLH